MRLAGVPGENCPLLESLSIKGVAIPSSANMGAEDATLLFAPRLSTLRLNNLPGNALAYLTGWYSITELFLDSDKLLCFSAQDVNTGEKSHWPLPLCGRHPPLSEVETVTRSLILRKSVQSWLVGEPDVLGNDLGTALFNLLTSYSRRWKSFEWTGSTLLPPLLALTPDEVPILESLSINVVGHSVDGSTASILVLIVSRFSVLKTCLGLFSSAGSLGQTSPNCLSHAITNNRLEPPTTHSLPINRSYILRAAAVKEAYHTTVFGEVDGQRVWSAYL
ncbi:hypothetical protein H2248_010169 [Termitomyces sp. 'cryptogamus']|nr:hypothetical protein H2248_010169 [Termitomyces sp. 'cryptogamus']